MVICKSTYPIYFAEKIADSLLKDAKRRSKEEREKYKKSKGKNGEVESTLSYLYLTSSIATESGGEILETVYENEKRILTLRPYTLSELEFLLSKSKELKEIFPTTQRNSLMMALSQGKFQSINFLFYQIARMEKKEREHANKVLREINEKFNGNQKAKGGWTKVEGKDATPLADLLEIIKIKGEYDA
jgi:hypothetical protein